jgi:hypothetical protein
MEDSPSPTKSLGFKGGQENEETNPRAPTSISATSRHWKTKHPKVYALDAKKRILKEK